MTDFVDSLYIVTETLYTELLGEGLHRDLYHHQYRVTVIVHSHRQFVIKTVSHFQNCGPKLVLPKIDPSTF